MHFLIKNWVANPQNVENVNILVRVSSLLHINLNHVMFNTRRKTCIFDYSLRQNFSRKRHFATKNPFNHLRQLACDKLVANDKGYCMKKKVNKYISSFDFIVYVLSHATKMQLFWS